MPKFRILPGQSFNMGADDKGDPIVKTGGEIVELDDDVARAHAHRIVPHTDDAPPAERGSALAPLTQSVSLSKR